jgi:ubiquinone/menaquinone biosynthesis C-methylase UbiE
MGLFSRFAQRRRRQMSRFFLDSIRPNPEDTCLELGGPIIGLTGVTERFHHYLVLNIDPQSLSMARELPSHQRSTVVLGDATEIPLKDASVDYVVSNALLEHIPPIRRPRLAEEVMRVARKGYFISAPNYWFPLEPHYYMPFFQFVPEAFKHWLTQRVRVGWQFKDNYVPISLATKRELRRLFPKATITGLSFNGLLHETIIAWERRDGS